MVIGITLYLVRLPGGGGDWRLVCLGFLALAGSGLISYTTARATTLDIDLGPPTYASKGTRMSVTIVCALASPLVDTAPLAALVYLAVHPNAVVVKRLITAHRQAGPRERA